MEKDWNKDENINRQMENLFGQIKNDSKSKEEFISQCRKKLEDLEKEEAEKQVNEKRTMFPNLLIPQISDTKKVIEEIERRSVMAYLGIKDEYSYSIQYPKFNRVDFSGMSFKKTLNFLINYCSSFSIPISIDQQKEEILKSKHYNNILSTLHTNTISQKSLNDIINGNKPLLPIGVNIVSLFRKNLLFLDYYVVRQKNVLDIGDLPFHWLKAIVGHHLFSNFKPCLVLNKDYKKSIEVNKLSTIKYFNDVILGEMKRELKSNSLDSLWIDSISKTYKKLYRNNYINCKAEKQVEFHYFSRGELEMFVYILLFNISISDNFPIKFENQINELLINQGIDPYLIEGLYKELSELNVNL